jgi:DNA polymerase/3'-5' exonuclease PolX
VDLQYARKKALETIQVLSPFCERIEYAGSVLRHKQEGINDIEIVCIPKIRMEKDLFGEEIKAASLLQEAIPGILFNWGVSKIIRNGPKWKTFIIPHGEGVKIDLFIVTAKTWGTNFAIRTGPSDYSKWLVTEKREGGAFPGHAKFNGSGFEISVGGTVLPMYEEKDFFNFLQIQMPEPCSRSVPATFKPRSNA